MEYISALWLATSHDYTYTDLGRFREKGYVDPARHDGAVEGTLDEQRPIAAMEEGESATTWRSSGLGSFRAKDARMDVRGKCLGSGMVMWKRCDIE